MNILNIYQTFCLNLSMCIPESGKVDLILMLLGLKPCLRTRMNSDHVNTDGIEKWCYRWNFNIYIDRENFTYISPNHTLMNHLIHVDHANTKHEVTLGKLLGYPDCCCKKIAEVGEENIDQYEAKLCEKEFPALFQLTNPKNYRNGSAFISHVPCSTTCINSLSIAKQLCSFIQNNKNFLLFNAWLKEIQKIDKENLCLYKP